MVVVKSPREIEKMKFANRIVAETLCRLKKIVKPGIMTIELERAAEKILRKHGAVAAFKNYMGFPSALCVSVNEEIVHGIPSRRRLQEGDIVSIDFGVKYDGYFGDAAITIPVGNVTETARKLLMVTQESLKIGIEMVKTGNRINDISRAIQEFVESRGYNVVRDFVGHGIGRKLHEPPQIPNYYDKMRREKLRPGMVLAIEPMVTIGTFDVRLLSDRWTAVTADGGLSAHFEHSVAVTQNGPCILSAMECIDNDKLFQWEID